MRTRQVAKQRRVRNQVDFANGVQRNRHGLRAAGTYLCAARANPSGCYILFIVYQGE